MFTDPLPPKIVCQTITTYYAVGFPAEHDPDAGFSAWSLSAMRKRRARSTSECRNSLQSECHTHRNRGGWLERRRPRVRLIGSQALAHRRVPPSRRVATDRCCAAARLRVDQTRRRSSVSDSMAGQVSNLCGHPLPAALIRINSVGDLYPCLKGALSNPSERGHSSKARLP